MCTLTVIRPREAGVRLRVLFNRDEQRSRPRALPPKWVELADRRALMPIDPQSGGTWIGVNDAGLIACLLNANLNAQREWGARASRGRIVPTVLHAADLASARERAAAIDPAAFPPCTLVLIDATGLVRFSSDGDCWTIDESGANHAPFFVTSSGLGDALVEPPRRELFERLLRDESHPLIAQARLHEHQWPDRRHLSVNMSRADARTVCRTRVDVGTAPESAFASCVFLHEYLTESGEPTEPSEHAFELRTSSRTQVLA